MIARWSNSFVKYWVALVSCWLDNVTVPLLKIALKVTKSFGEATKSQPSWLSAFSPNSVLHESVLLNGPALVGMLPGLIAFVYGAGGTLTAAALAMPLPNQGARAVATRAPPAMRRRRAERRFIPTPSRQVRVGLPTGASRPAPVKEW